MIPCGITDVFIEWIFSNSNYCRTKLQKYMWNAKSQKKQIRFHRNKSLASVQISLIMKYIKTVSKRNGWIDKTANYKAIAAFIKRRFYESNTFPVFWSHNLLPWMLEVFCIPHETEIQPHLYVVAIKSMHFRFHPALVTWYIIPHNVSFLRGGCIEMLYFKV